RIASVPLASDRRRLLARPGRPSAAQHLRQLCGGDCRGYEPPTMGKMTLPSVSFSHGQCAISLPHHRTTYSSAVTHMATELSMLPSKIRPPAAIGGQYRSMFDFTRFDDGDIAEQAAVGNNPRRQRPHQ